MPGTQGDVSYEVADGCRMVVSAGPGGVPRVAVQLLGDSPTWRWAYSKCAWSGEISVELQELL